MIEIIPRSKLAAAMAAAYLLLVFFLLLVTVFGGGGLHGNAAMAVVFVIGLTLPLSWFVMWILDSLKPAPELDYLFIPLLLVCALINAGVIYLLFGLAAQALRALYVRYRLRH